MVQNINSNVYLGKKFKITDIYIDNSVPEIYIKVNIGQKSHLTEDYINDFVI